MKDRWGARRVLLRPYLFLTRVLFDPLLFDPLPVVRKWRALPSFARNLAAYLRGNQDPAFRVRACEVVYRSFDRFSTAAELPLHYFYQDLWAARTLHDRGIREHVDVGSRVDGFTAHLLSFCRVRYVDLRPLEVCWEGFEYRQGSLTTLPFADGTVTSLSCLHVLEHVGLGRYGDTVDPQGHVRAARELCRVLGHGGLLLVGTPVGRERLCFDAHRVFDPETVVKIFQPLKLTEFHLIDDMGRGVIRNASFEQARKCEYGCGLFGFDK